MKFKSQTSNNKKLKNYKFGIFAEFLSCLILNVKGYKILERRYKTKLGEIDIIAQKNNFICFIEVKARKKKNNEVLTSKQRERITDAAKHYIARKVQYNDLNYRFDLIIYTPPLTLKHIISAWHE